MATEALEQIVGDTTIDIYPPGTTALYWGLSREEEEWAHMEEQRREMDKREIENAIRAEYTGGPSSSHGLETTPQAPNWILDQPNYGSEKIGYSISFGSTTQEIPPLSYEGTGCSFTTHVGPESSMPLEVRGLYHDSEPIEPTIHSLQIDGVDHSHWINSLPEPTPLSSPGGMGWGFEMKLEPPIAPIDPMRGIDHIGMPDTNLNPFKSYLEDTHIGQNEKPYVPTFKSTWDTDLMPKPEPVNYMSPVSNIMNRIGMPELDLQPKPYLPPSLSHLQGMDFSDKPDTAFRPVPSLMEDMQSTRRKYAESIIIPNLDPAESVLECMKTARHGLTAELIDVKPKPYIPPSLRYLRDLGPANEPEPEPVIPFRPPVSAFVQEMLDSLDTKSSEGLLTKDDYAGCIDLPGIGAQLHLHGPDSSDFTKLTLGQFMDYSRNNIGDPLNSYESAMADLWADQFKFKKYMKK